MKGLKAAAALILITATTQAAVLERQNALNLRSESIPSRFLTSNTTRSIEWGCPVAELVAAPSQAEAIQKISNECIEQVGNAARAKHGVFDVIKTSVIFPDVEVARRDNGYYLQGTFFLETLVLQTGEQRP